MYYAVQIHSVMGGLAPLSVLFGSRIYLTKQLGYSFLGPIGLGSVFGYLGPLLGRSAGDRGVLTEGGSTSFFEPESTTQVLSVVSSLVILVCALVSLDVLLRKCNAQLLL